MAAVCAKGADAAEPRFVFSAAASNDLYRVLVESTGSPYARFDTPAEAIAAAPKGAGVLILADGYPRATTPIDAALLARAKRKGLRVYVEFPSQLPGVTLGKSAPAPAERGVAADASFGEAFPPMGIVAINGLHYQPAEVKGAHLVAARVAGFDSAVFGLPTEAGKVHPLLFELPGHDVLVATTKLSHFLTGRFAPQEAWRAIWAAVLRWLQPAAEAPALRWRTTVQPAYSRTAPLPADAEAVAVRRGVEWFAKSKLLVHAGTAKRARGAGRMPVPPDDAAIGDGGMGIMEAPLSVIDPRGRQQVSVAIRGDCNAESAMALAVGGKWLGNDGARQVGRKLLDYYLFESTARKGDRGNRDHGAYGLTAWGVSSPAWYKANYGDDNARLILGTLAAAAVETDDRWDEAIMMCLLANLRTTGRYGFRTGRIDLGPLGKRGWRHYFNGKPVNYAPHYEAYLWACYLWAYRQTGFDLFRQRAETAIAMTMAKYPAGWRWTNGLAQEKARMLLPLAWQVRVSDTPANRAMLRKVANDVIALQAACGAITEEIGDLRMGAYPPPQSNAAYGTTEASLLGRNGDKVTDLLYTANFAFLGLHEAARATGDANIRRACDKLAEFLCRIQIRSRDHRYLDGGWFRAFDYGRWEQWGCNADAGWGAWCIESGWTQGWIVTVLAMRQMNTSLWDLTADSKIERHFDRLRRQMLPDDALESVEPTRDDPPG